MEKTMGLGGYSDKLAMILGHAAHTCDDEAEAAYALIDAATFAALNAEISMGDVLARIAESMETAERARDVQGTA